MHIKQHIYVVFFTACNVAGENKLKAMPPPPHPLLVFQKKLHEIFLCSATFSLFMKRTSIDSLLVKLERFKA